MTTSALKDEARRIIEQLPEGATWEDLMYRIYVRQVLEAGLKDSQEARTLPVDQVRKQFGLPT